MQLSFPEPPAAALPPPTMDEARRVLAARFGFPDFRPSQKPILEAVLAGRDALAIMPTGAGKSLCFQLPALLLPGVTIVVSPLIALMKDQVDSLQQKGIPATFINSSIGLGDQEQRMQAVRSGQVRLLYVAPERFRSRAFLRALEGLRLSLLAIDEAHCIKPSAACTCTPRACLARSMRACRMPRWRSATRRR